MLYTLTASPSSNSTAVALASSRTPAAWCTIKAIKDSGAANTGNVYIGPKGVDNTSGYPLTPGQEVVLRPEGSKLYIDFQSLYVFTATANDAVKVLYAKD